MHSRLHSSGLEIATQPASRPSMILPDVFGLDLGQRLAGLDRKCLVLFKLERVTQVANRAVPVAVPLKDEPSMEVGTPEVRIEANGGLKLDHRSPEIALFAVRRAAAGVAT